MIFGKAYQKPLVCYTEDLWHAKDFWYAIPKIFGMLHQRHLVCISKEHRHVIPKIFGMLYQ